MKCRGKSCNSYFDNFFYPICSETNTRTNTDAECKLPNNIRDTRDELLRKCELLENLLEIVDEKLDDLIEKMEELK